VGEHLQVKESGIITTLKLNNMKKPYASKAKARIFGLATKESDRAERISFAREHIKSKALKKKGGSVAEKQRVFMKKQTPFFRKQQAGIMKERNAYAKKHPGTYKGRPIHELRKEAGLDQ